MLVVVFGCSYVLYSDVVDKVVRNDEFFVNGKCVICDVFCRLF